MGLLSVLDTCLPTLKKFKIYLTKHFQFSLFFKTYISVKKKKELKN